MAPREIRILNIDHRQITVEIRGEPSKHVKDSPQMPGKIQSNPKTRGEALMSLLLQSLWLLCQSKIHQRWGAVGCVEFPSLNMQWGLFRAAFLLLWITWSYATGNKEACWGHKRVPAGQRMRGAVTWKSEKLVVLAADFTGWSVISGVLWRRLAGSDGAACLTTLIQTQHDFLEAAKWRFVGANLLWPCRRTFTGV